MSKGLFELMQMQEIETTNFLPTKKEVIKSSENFAKNLIENGEFNKIELLAQSTRLKDAVTVVHDTLKASVLREKANGFGIEIIPVNGRKIIEFSEDPIWRELKKSLKDREALLTLAQHQETADLYGNIVPKVSLKFSSDSLIIKY
jgi:hypothetical protein